MGKLLLQTNHSGYFPLHYASSNSSFQGFRSVFDFGIRYFPSKRGISLLFQKDDDCETPINSMDALMLAAIDEHIHLDGVYFVLRRQPDVLTRMLPPRLTNNNNNNSNITCDQDSTVNDDDDDDHDD